jgi:hypothetical protein
MCSKRLNMFIDITERNMEKLLPVLMKPEEEEAELENPTGSQYSTSWRLLSFGRQSLYVQVKRRAK